MYREAVDETLGVRVFKRARDLDPIEIVLETSWNTPLHKRSYTRQNPFGLLGLEFFTVSYPHGWGKRPSASSRSSTSKIITPPPKITLDLRPPLP